MFCAVLFHPFCQKTKEMHILIFVIYIAFPANHVILTIGLTKTSDTWLDHRVSPVFGIVRRIAARCHFFKIRYKAIPGLQMAIASESRFFIIIPAKSSPSTCPWQVRPPACPNIVSLASAALPRFLLAHRRQGR